MKETNATQATTPITKRNKTLGVLALAAAALIALPAMIGGGASAALDDGKFCIGSQYGEEEIFGKAGGKLCDAPPVVVAPPLPAVAPLVITSCTVSTMTPFPVFSGFTISWNSPLAPEKQKATFNSATIPAAHITASKVGELYNYTASMTSQQISSEFGSLLTASSTLRIEANRVAGTSTPNHMDQGGYSSGARTLSIGGILGLGGNNTCTVPISESFEIQGATDGVTYGAPTKTSLPVSAPVAGIAVGETRYAVYSVRTTTASPAGSVRLVSNTANGERLTYGVKTISGTTCNATTFGMSTNEVIKPGTLLRVGATATQSLAAKAATPTTYCFAITRPSTDTAGAYNGTANWTIG